MEPKPPRVTLCQQPPGRQQQSRFVPRLPRSSGKPGEGQCRALHATDRMSRGDLTPEPRDPHRSPAGTVPLLPLHELRRVPAPSGQTVGPHTGRPPEIPPDGRGSHSESCPTALPRYRLSVAKTVPYTLRSLARPALTRVA